MDVKPQSYVGVGTALAVAMGSAHWGGAVVGGPRLEGEEEPRQRLGGGNWKSGFIPAIQENIGGFLGNLGLMKYVIYDLRRSFWLLHKEWG